jgi:hypothetical protein
MNTIFRLTFLKRSFTATAKIAAAGLETRNKVRIPEPARTVITVNLVFFGCLVCASLAAAPYITIRAEHDCTHDDFCSGCIQLRGALDLLKQLNTVAVRTAPAAGAFGTLAAPVRITTGGPVPVSGVSLKVRMNT